MHSVLYNAYLLQKITPITDIKILCLNKTHIADNLLKIKSSIAHWQPLQLKTEHEYMFCLQLKRLPVGNKTVLIYIKFSLECRFSSGTDTNHNTVMFRIYTNPIIKLNTHPQQKLSKIILWQWLS